MALPPPLGASPRGLLAHGGGRSPQLRRGLGGPGPGAPATPLPRAADTGRQPQRARPAWPHWGPRQPQPAQHRGLPGTEEDSSLQPAALRAAKAQPVTHLPAPPQPPPLPYAGPGRPFRLPCPARPHCRAPARARHRRPRKRGRARPAPPPLPRWRREGTAPAPSRRPEHRAVYTRRGAMGGVLRLLPSPLKCGGLSAGCGCACGRPRSRRAYWSCGSKQRSTEVALFVSVGFFSSLLSTRTMSVSALLPPAERRTERESCSSLSPTLSFAAESCTLSWGIFLLGCG